MEFTGVGPLALLGQLDPHVYSVSLWYDEKPFRPQNEKDVPPVMYQFYVKADNVEMGIRPHVFNTLCTLIDHDIVINPLELIKLGKNAILGKHQDSLRDVLLPMGLAMNGNPHRYSITKTANLALYRAVETEGIKTAMRLTARREEPFV